MKRLWRIGLMFAVLGVLVGFAYAPVMLRPGDRVGTMRVVSGTPTTAETTLWDRYCDPTHRGGVHPCGRVPPTRSLFIGNGLFATTPTMPDVWASTSWRAWFDGHPIVLPAFGTSDRFVRSYFRAGFRDVLVREWRVMVVKPTPGRHTIRYRVVPRNGFIGTIFPVKGVTDTAWTFRVASD